MPETNADANATAGNLDPDVGLSSSPDGITVRTDATARATSTVEDDSAKGAAGDATEGDKAAADKVAADLAAAAAAKDGEGGEGDKKTGAKGQEGRFDKDPDWIRMKQERDEAVLKAARLEGAAEALKGVQAQPRAENKPQELPFKDITKIPKEELLAWFEDDPVGYEANKFAQFMWERDQIVAQRTQQQATTTSVQETMGAYQKDNPDFLDKWKSGEITKFMQDHPGHNAISAHMALTGESRTQAAIDAAVAKAVKETEDRVIKNFQAKKNAATISDGSTGPAVPGDADKEMLKDTKKFGGREAVLAERLRQRREAAGAAH